MDETSKFLYDWALRYLKHKDLIHRRIQGIKEEADSFIMTYKDKEERVLPLPHLSDLEKVGFKDSFITIFTFNTQENFDFLVASWKALAAKPGLCIYFINPQSASEDKWMIRPNIHSKIADPESLEKGLSSMFSCVDVLSPAETKKVINAEGF